MDSKKVLVGSLFVASLITANFTASKVVGVELPVFGYLIFPAGFLAYALTFLFTDIYSEVWGREEAGKLVIYGFWIQIYVVALTLFAIYIPPAPFHAEYQQIYERVLGSTPNIVAASLIAYIISQTHDVYAFHFWKRVTRGRHLWLRNNASTLASQLIDTVIFIYLAFGVFPWLMWREPLIPWSALPNMVVCQYIVKVLVALTDTPFCYLGVKLVRK